MPNIGDVSRGQVKHLNAEVRELRQALQIRLEEEMR